MEFRGGTDGGNPLGNITDESHMPADAPCQACEDAKQKAVPRTGSGRQKTIRCKECQLEHDKEVRQNYRKTAASKRKAYKKEFQEYVVANGGDQIAARKQMRLDNGKEPMGLKACEACRKDFAFSRMPQVRCHECQIAYDKAGQA